MIRLTPAKTYITTFTRTGSNNAGYYTITHNLNTLNFNCTILFTDSAGNLQKLSNIFDFFGHTIQSINLNSFSLRVWQWYPETLGNYTNTFTATVYITAIG